MTILPKVLLFFALILRIAYVLVGKSLSHEVWSDMLNYVNISGSVAHGKWDPYHFFQSIGYPMVILFIRKFFSDWGLVLSLLQAILSFLSVWLMFRLASKSFGEKVGLWALILGTFHFPWIGYTGYALPEMMFAFFLMLAAWCSYKIVLEERMTLYSFGWGMTFLCALWLKGTHVFWGPIFLLGLLFYKKQKALLPCLIISGIVGFGIVSHGILTYKTIGRFQVSASAGGLNFLEGKCSSKENADSVGYSWQSPLYYQLRMDESKKWDRPFTDSGFFMKEGFKCVLENPFSLIQSLESIPFLFIGNTLWPLNQKPYFEKVRLYELLYGMFCLVGITMFVRWLCLFGVREEDVMVWILPVVSLFLCVYVFKSEVRFRVPFDGWIIPIAMKGWYELLQIKGPKASEKLQV